MVTMEVSDSDTDSRLSANVYISHKTESCTTGRLGTSRARSPFVIENHSQKSRNRKARCSSKNAVIARENRLRKKEYLEKVENEVLLLRKENYVLKEKLHKRTNFIKSLKSEVMYLKNVINNRTSIKYLLSGLNRVLQEKIPEVEDGMGSSSNLSMSNSWYSQLKDNHRDPLLTSNVSDGISFSDPDDASLLLADVVKNEDTSFPQVGICLHINNNKISMEFCSQCNASSREDIFS